MIIWKKRSKYLSLSLYISNRYPSYAPIPATIVPGILIWPGDKLTYLYPSIYRISSKVLIYE